MSANDQFALGLLAQIVESLSKRLDDLEERMADIEAMQGETEGARYLDGSQ